MRPDPRLTIPQVHRTIELSAQRTMPPPRMTLPMIERPARLPIDEMPTVPAAFKPAIAIPEEVLASAKDSLSPAANTAPPPAEPATRSNAKSHGDARRVLTMLAAAMWLLGALALLAVVFVPRDAAMRAAAGPGAVASPPPQATDTLPRAMPSAPSTIHRPSSSAAPTPETEGRLDPEDAPRGGYFVNTTTE